MFTYIWSINLNAFVWIRSISDVAQIMWLRVISFNDFIWSEIYETKSVFSYYLILIILWFKKINLIVEILNFLLLRKFLFSKHENNFSNFKLNILQTNTHFKPLYVTLLLINKLKTLEGRCTHVCYFRLTHVQHRKLSFINFKSTYAVNFDIRVNWPIL